jgi:hypothetical protein
MDIKGIGCEGVNWIPVAQDMIQYQTFVIAVMKIRLE